MAGGLENRRRRDVAAIDVIAVVLRGIPRRGTHRPVPMRIDLLILSAPAQLSRLVRPRRVGGDEVVAALALGVPEVPRGDSALHDSVSIARSTSSSRSLIEPELSISYVT